MGPFYYPIDQKAACPGGAPNLKRFEAPPKTRLRRTPAIRGRSIACALKLVRYHGKLGELRGAKRRRNRNISGVAASCDQYATNSRAIVPRIECIPFASDEYLKPCAKVHGSRIPRHANISKITCAISGRDVHAATQRNAEMSEISADANPLLVAFRGRAIGSRVMITELDSIVDVIANRLNALPSVNMAELGPSEIAQLLGIAVSAAEQIDQRFVR